MLFYAIFNNISAISWWLVLLVEKTKGRVTRTPCSSCFTSGTCPVNLVTNPVLGHEWGKKGPSSAYDKWNIHVSISFLCFVLCFCIVCIWSVSCMPCTKYCGSCYSIFCFMCMFCRSLFVLLSFFFWPLCCLSFFYLRILIIFLWYLQTLLTTTRWWKM
jgi:hypothetical protein